MNKLGQLGLGDTTSRNTFTEVTGIAGTISTVIGGLHHTYILATDNKLYDTGRNDHGQLGLGDTSNRNVFTMQNDRFHTEEEKIGLTHNKIL